MEAQIEDIAIIQVWEHEHIEGVEWWPQGQETVLGTREHGKAETSELGNWCEMVIFSSLLANVYSHVSIMSV